MNTQVKRVVKFAPAVLGMALAAGLSFGVAPAIAAPAGQDCTVVREASYPTSGGAHTFVESDLRNGKPRVPSDLRGREISMWHQAWGMAKSEYEQALNTCVSTPIKPSTPAEEVTYPTSGGKYTFVEAELRYGKPRVPSELRGREISEWHQAWGIAKSEYERTTNR